MKNVLLINDTERWYHFGCTGTSFSLKEQIKALGYMLTALPINATYEIKAQPSTAEAFKPKEQFAIFKAQNAELIQSIEKCDILLINGEGTIHGLKPAPLALLYAAYTAKTFLNKWVGIINHSAYPQDHNLSLDDENVIGIYKLVYQTIDFAAIREPISYKLMTSLGIKAIESFDCMPLYIKNHFSPGQIIKNTKNLIVGGSPIWANMTNFLATAPNAIKEYESVMEAFSKYLDNMGKKAFTVTFLYGALNYPAQDDQEFMTYLKTKNITNFHTVEAKTLDEWLATIGNATLLISGRFHHSIAASCLGTPFIAINSNTPKVSGLLEVIGDEKVIQYNDPDLLQKLTDMTEIKLKEPPMNTAARAILLSRLCEKAMNNFSKLPH
ncbi:MAG: polysaccharide pyruvyl transferase family protein [Proteobacteria bacterium]|nr:polysaccharide pyruvyl transferase family protein [Pseudomonadota bacterium]